MKRRLFLFLAAILVSATAFAQNQKISGKVIDSAGQPVIGASVLVPGTTIGAATDIDGAYSCEVPVGSTIEASSIGYVSQTAKVTANQSVYNFTLAEDSEMLESTVVVGYGTTKRENFTGSVSTYKVGSGPVANQTRSSAVEMLRGLAPGVSMSQSGVAGAEPSMQVRGQKSISGGSDPLIVLDGVIYKGSIMDIDPNTVESMSVMKDATSLAAYGSQAANGVIMITSKKGVNGKPTINFKGSVALVGQNYKPDFRDGYEYITMYNDRNNLEAGNTGWMSSLEKANYEKGKQTDWNDYVTRTGVQQDYSLNISGGSEGMNYLVGASYSDNTNFIKGNEFIRETVTGRLNMKVSKSISAGINFNYADTQNDGVRPSFNSRISPWAEPYLSDGKTMRKYVDGKEESTVNPLWDTENGMDYEVRGSNVNVGGNIEVKFPWVDGLSYKITGNYTVNNNRIRSFTHETNFITMALGEDAYKTEAFDKWLSSASGYIQNSKTINYVLDNILTYVKEFDKHYINATAVYTRDFSKVEATQFSGSDFSSLGNTTLGFWGLNNAAVQTIDSITYTLHTDVGYLGRLNYSYDNKYHFNVSVRRDGSSVFGSDHKWGTFPAFGAAWTTSDESFMKGTKGWLDYLKVKLSWGKNGNQSLSPYGTLSRMAVGKSGGNTYYFGDGAHFGQKLSTLGNSGLGWETTTSWNGGFEADLFGRKLHWEVDAYRSKTTDQIFSRIVPVMGSGISTQSATMGQVNNWGIESTLNYKIIEKGKFSWNTSVMFTINRNKLVELYGGEDEEDDITNGLFIGKSLGAIYGYKWIGVVQNSDTAYMTANGAQPGDAKYADLDNDGKITAADRQILGYSKEAFRASMTHTFTYGNWSLYMMFNGIFSGGQYGKAANNMAYLSSENMQYVNSLDHPYWTESNPSNKYPRSSFSDTRFTALQSYGFVRLQDVNLAYNVNASFLKKINVSSVQLYVSGKNLFFIAPHWEFSDPEVRSYSSAQLPRTFTLGANIRF